VLRRVPPAWLLAAAGGAGAVIAAGLRPADARLAAVQDWPPFVLVAGLLLIGLVADGDGLFAWAGGRLDRAARRDVVLLAGATVIIAAVTVTLNLDTSVAFLTPVLVHTARARRGLGVALVYGCLMLSNAGSLLLPGSNLTNLIVLGHLRLTGGQFAARMWLPWLAAVVVTALVVAWRGHGRAVPDAAVPDAAVPDAAVPGGTAPDAPGMDGAGPPGCGSAEAGDDERGGAESDPARFGSRTGSEAATPGRPVLGVGLAAVTAAVVLVVTLGAPALPVAAVGVAAAGYRLARGRVSGWPWRWAPWAGPGPRPPRR
jgi:hypothetical protein